MAPRITTLLPGESTRSRSVWDAPDVTDHSSSVAHGPLHGLPFSGAKALLFAVLDDGIRCYFSANPRIRLEAEHWIDDPRGRGPFGFQSICELFLLDPDAVRASLRRLRLTAHQPRHHVRPRGPRKRRIA